ncbi:MAG: DUF1003 domain-containing protein [Flavobacteriales bacterium]|nr:DUF1003 domain-containing protein [Flavobacteriales bacterium]MBK6945927.1 DUF1003 domain-containing protein [Flavobacteriales bacterium]MBK7239138.1 DUF1003 domain-containing protein [Flavobacteriales bacterium]MBK9536756.1 DUF1003 domain-containing protein [Flavobacteriales bacterium]MBP9138236.1 DUF1003 domain-containing protein [Flavobacteriales bacterium]
MAQRKKQLLAVEQEQLNRLHTIVENSIREEELVVNNLLHPPSETLKRGQRISDKIARFGGSWAFILIFLGILTVWIVFNVTVVLSDRFDPYPFILMNLILSCVAAMQAPVIMMSQNRKEERDRMRAENDYLINLKAELQIRSLHQKVDLLLEEQIKTLFDVQAQQMELLTRIEKRLTK